MKDINTITILGRLVRDPELKEYQQGKVVASISIAVSGYKDSSHFFECSIFGKGAEIIQMYAHKGSQIAIRGELNQQRWEDKETRQPRSKVVIMVSDFQLVGNKKSNDNYQQPDQNNNSENAESYSSSNDDDMPF